MESLTTPVRPVYVLAVVCVALFVIPLTITGSGVLVLPISKEFGASYLQAQWVICSFMVSYAAFMAITGVIADALGRKLLFVSGILLFAIASALAGCANNLLLLIVARAVTGLGAAAVTTAGTALLASVYTGPARVKAFTLFGTALGLGLAVGPVVAGGVVTFAGSWRPFFAAIAVILAGVSVFGLRLPQSRSQERHAVDWLGGVLFTGCLVVFVSAFSLAPASGWTDSTVLSLLVIGALLVPVFIQVEARTSQPILNMQLFSNHQFLAVCVTPVFLGFGYISLLFYLPQYLAVVAKMSAFEVGVALMFSTVPSLLFPLFFSLLRRQPSLKKMMSLTFLFMVIGPISLALTIDHPTLLSLALPLFITGSSFGVSLAYLDGAAVSVVSPHRSGMAAGMFNTFRLGGEALAIPALGMVVVALLSMQTADRQRGLSILAQGDIGSAAQLLALPEALLVRYLTVAMQGTLAVISIVSFVGLLIVLRLSTQHTTEGVEYAR